MAKNISVVLDSSKLKTNTRKAPTPYKPFKFLDNRISEEQRSTTQKIFETVQAELGKTVFDANVYTENLLNIAAPVIGKIIFDVDAGTKSMIQAVDESGMRYGRDKFLDSVFR